MSEIADKDGAMQSAADRGSLRLERRVRKVVREVFQALPYLRVMVVLASLPKLKIWQRTKAAGMPVVTGRRTLHAEVARPIRGDRILYLEFGVFQGDSIRYWLTLNDNPASRFVGFDTFTGLPEKWETNAGLVPGGTFDTGGAPPVVGDARCSFEKGLFQDTLPAFLEKIDPSQFDRILLHLDADLYTSTLFVLTESNALIRPGTVLIFDEFSGIMHEFRAFEDWSSTYRRAYTPLMATHHLDQVAVRID